MQHPDQNLKLSLSEALHRYWMNLIGVAVFPSTAFIGVELFHMPLLDFVPAFFLVCGLAGWPYLARRAPYTFWIVVCGIWMAGALFGAVLLQIIKKFIA